MPSAKMVRRRRLPPLNRSTSPSASRPAVLKNCCQQLGIDAGRGDVRAQAIDGQDAQREQHALAQVGNAEDIGQLFKHRSSLRALLPASDSAAFLRSKASACSSIRMLSFLCLRLATELAAADQQSALPPAFSIFSCAAFENLCACTVTAAVSSPSPSTLISAFASAPDRVRPASPA